MATGKTITITRKEARKLRQAFHYASTCDFVPGGEDAELFRRFGFAAGVNCNRCTSIEADTKKRMELAQDNVLERVNTDNPKLQLYLEEMRELEEQHEQNVKTLATDTVAAAELGQKMKERVAETKAAYPEEAALWDGVSEQVNNAQLAILDEPVALDLHLQPWNRLPLRLARGNYELLLVMLTDVPDEILEMVEKSRGETKA